MNFRIVARLTAGQTYYVKVSAYGSNTGYFSIDKKTGRSVDSQLKRGSEFSDDISAYDLILKNKERLLSFDEPTRFIFSHSALREGWDNPNVFQICTLKHSDSQTAKRQEVGRGLRLCVNQSGNRMDKETLGDTVHNVNMLTVIASESYKDFVKDLQSDIKKELYDRPSKASIEYFEGKTVMVGGEQIGIDKTQAKIIYKYLAKNDYIDNDDNVTDKYRADFANDTLAPVPEEISDIADGMHKLVQAVFDESVLDDMIDIELYQRDFQFFRAQLEAAEKANAELPPEIDILKAKELLALYPTLPDEGKKAFWQRIIKRLEIDADKNIRVFPV